MTLIDDRCPACIEKFGEDSEDFCPDSCAGCGGYHCPAEPCDISDDAEVW